MSGGHQRASTRAETLSPIRRKCVYAVCCCKREDRQARGLAIFQLDLLEHHSNTLRRTWPKRGEREVFSSFLSVWCLLFAALHRIFSLSALVCVSLISRDLFFLLRERVEGAEGASQQLIILFSRHSRACLSLDFLSIKERANTPPHGTGEPSGRRSFSGLRLSTRMTPSNVFLASSLIGVYSLMR